jgi:hypothetical protein
MVTTMAFLQYYLKSSTKRGWEMSSLLVAIQNQGISRVKSQGKHCGRPSKVNSSLISSVRLLREKGVSIRDISKTCSIGVGTTMKIVKEHGIEPNGD